MLNDVPSVFIGRWVKSIPHNCEICNRPATISADKFGYSYESVYHCAPCYNDYLRWLERFRRENPQWAAEEDHRRKYPRNFTRGIGDFTDTNTPVLPKNKVSFIECWLKATVALIVLQGLQDYFNPGDRSVPITLKFNLMISAFSGFWIGWIWWSIKK
jgi:hypothetical protein